MRLLVNFIMPGTSSCFYFFKKKIQLFLLLLVNVLDSKWIQVIFETPELKVGSLWFQYGGEREVKLEITYVTRRSDKGKG